MANTHTHTKKHTHTHGWTQVTVADKRARTSARLDSAVVATQEAVAARPEAESESEEGGAAATATEEAEADALKQSKLRTTICKS